ncbi:MAG: respiratory nitrate reductase subunit gamma [Myxococcales bacterium]|nr:respiratory nitrate reductase subunit gamma [Myxococcales bacterium]
MSYVLFGAFPYVAVVLLLLISIQRYRVNQFTISSLSSQFLESEKLFWGSVPFHLGILVLFFGHLIGFLIPREVQLFASSPLRLLVLELTGFVAALLFAVGLVLLIHRRLTSKRLREVTTFSDYLVYGLLLFQAATGLYIALFLRWGTAWYVQVAVPYLHSLFLFQPDVARISSVPVMVQAHILGAFTLFAVFSFTRLMHVLVVPIPYLWRRTQLVIWNRDRHAVRKVEG